VGTIRRVATKKKARRKSKARRSGSRKPKAAAKGVSLAAQVAEQMASVVQRGVARMLRKLPARAATRAAKSKLKDAILVLRRQAEAFRQQAGDLEARGAEAAASVWRPLGDRIERAADQLRRRLARRG
jgi:hypothetical protein